jgi:hypothetical protein
MEWAEKLFLFGLTPAAAAGAVWGVFKLLKYSAPFKSAVLDTLTHPTRPPAVLLRHQYRIVRDVVIGSKHFGLKRVLLAAGVTCLWILALALGLLAYQTHLTFFGFVAAQYFAFASDHPMIYAALVLLTIAMLLIVVEVFDLLLTSRIFRLRSLAINALWLCIAYIVSLLAAAFLINICLEVVSIIDSLSVRHIPGVVVSSISRVITFAAHPWALPLLLVEGLLLLLSLQPFNPEALVALIPLGSFEDVFIIMGYVVLLPMLMSSIFVLTILNVAFFLGLLFVRTDLFLREKYGYDQKKILEEPVEYLGRVACCMAVILVLTINVCLLLFNQIAPPFDEKTSLSAPDLRAFSRRIGLHGLVLAAHDDVRAPRIVLAPEEQLA